MDGMSSLEGQLKRTDNQIEGFGMDKKNSFVLTGGEAIAKALSVHDSKIMFGIGGFQLIPLYDALHRAGNMKPRHILVNDERSGVFAADAYARVTRKPGLCDATLGPGATNLTTGLVEAYTAGTPIISFVGDSNRNHSGKNMTQETRQREILSPVVKEFISVERGHRIPELVRRAFVAATGGRPGPVVLSIPEDVAHGKWEYSAEDFYAEGCSLTIPAHRIRPDVKPLKEAAALITESSRPVLLAGGGIHLSNAYQELQSFVEKLGIPIAYTLTGKGCIPCNHPLCINLFGRFDRNANELIKKSDLVIAAGFKFGEIATNRYSLIPRNTKVIQIEISAEEIGKHQKVDVGLWADCKAGLACLLEEIDGAEKQRNRRQVYLKEIQELKKQWLEKNLPRLSSGERPISMARLCHELSAIMPEKGILVADGGFAALWTGLFYDVPSAGRGYVANRGNASIGYGLPGGIGAQLGAGSLPVVAITGDQGCNMSLGDLEMAIREKVPVTFVVINNAASGYVKSGQHAMFNGRYQSSTLHEMNYAEIARAMGAYGERVDDPERLSSVLSEAITQHSGPFVVDVVVTRDPARMLPGVDSRSQAAPSPPMPSSEGQ
jgi:acetolactate synthase-1/2/3 large subunit